MPEYLNLTELSEALETPESTLRSWRKELGAFIPYRREGNVVLYDLQRFEEIRYLVNVWMLEKPKKNLTQVRYKLAARYPEEAVKAEILVPDLGPSLPGYDTPALPAPHELRGAGFEELTALKQIYQEMLGAQTKTLDALASVSVEMQRAAGQLTEIVPLLQAHQDLVTTQTAVTEEIKRAVLQSIETGAATAEAVSTLTERQETRVSWWEMMWFSLLGLGKRARMTAAVIIVLVVVILSVCLPMVVSAQGKICPISPTGGVVGVPDV